MSELLTVRKSPADARSRGRRPNGQAARLAALFALPVLLLAACGGGWSSDETYTGDIRPTVPRPAGAGLGATAEPEPPAEPAAPAAPAADEEAEEAEEPSDAS